MASCILTPPIIASAALHKVGALCTVCDKNQYILEGSGSGQQTKGNGTAALLLKLCFTQTTLKERLGKIQTETGDVLIFYTSKYLPDILWIYGTAGWTVKELKPLFCQIVNTVNILATLDDCYITFTVYLKNQKHVTQCFHH